MGLLRRKGATDVRTAYLRSETKIGRDADNDVVLARPSVSGRHAVIRWTASGWVLKDSSKYGTLINGALIRGNSHPVAQGDELTFVEADEVWTVETAAGPGLLLTDVESMRPPIHVDAHDGFCAFPSGATPTQTLLQVSGSWFVESETGDRRQLVDGSTVMIGGARYTVSAPAPLALTAEPENPAARWTLEAVELSIVVLRGEDEAELTLRSGAIERVIKPSRPLYLLAYLAEYRIKDDDGWLPTELACDELRVDRTVLNVDVHRIREALKTTGLANAANIVERRPSQIRIGVPAKRCRVSRG